MVNIGTALARIADRARKIAGRVPAAYTWPVRISKPDGDKILVLAPHPDDETIGCGGTLYKHGLSGDQVVVAFMTDGREGDYFCAERGHALVDRRKREAEKASELLGLSELVFLDHPDARLSTRPSAIDDIASLLERVQPDIVYVTSVLDSHADHRATFDIAARALECYGNEVAIYIYEIWSPIPINCVVEIDMDKKIECVRCYQSQLDEDKVLEIASWHLAKFRAISNLLGPQSFAECFWRCSASEFISLARNSR